MFNETKHEVKKNKKTYMNKFPCSGSEFVRASEAEVPHFKLYNHFSDHTYKNIKENLNDKNLVVCYEL